jgi:hypothetical protein
MSLMSSPFAATSKSMQLSIGSPGVAESELY